MESNTPVWSPYLLQDIAKIESVQRFFTKSAFYRCGIPYTSYEDRLFKVNLKSLEERRLMHDLILTFKIVKGLSILKFSDYFVFVSSGYNLRRNSFQIKSIRSFKNTQFSNIFFERVVKIWNCLPDEIVSITNLNIFKLKLKAFSLKPFTKLQYS